MGFDPVVLLMEDGPHAQVALEFFEGFFDLGQGDVVLPEGDRIALREVAAQEVAAFPPADLPQRWAIQHEVKVTGSGLGFCGFLAVLLAFVVLGTLGI